MSDGRGCGDQTTRLSQFTLVAGVARGGNQGRRKGASRKRLGNAPVHEAITVGGEEEERQDADVAASLGGSGDWVACAIKRWGVCA